MKHPGIIFEYKIGKKPTQEVLFTVSYAQDLRKIPSSHTEEPLDPLRETVVLPGEPLSIIKEEGSFALVKAWWQPTWNKIEGCFEPYQGWIQKEDLDPIDLEANWKLITSHRAHMRQRPSFDAISAGYLPMGALYVEKDEEDLAWHALEIEKKLYYVHDKDLSEWNWLQDCSEDVLRWQWRQGAARMKSLKYVLGGLRTDKEETSSSYSLCGVDCSGLLHLSARRMGRVIPRNAKDQYLYLTPIEATDLGVGDLIFLGKESTDKIDHVIMQEEMGYWLESCRHYGGAVLHASETRKIEADESMWMASVSKIISIQNVGEYRE